MIDEIGYEPERDLDNTADSVFCSHGAGVNIAWDKVKDYMHLPSCLEKEGEERPLPTPGYRSLSIDERELEAIMEREFGPIRRKEYSAPQRNQAPVQSAVVQNKKEYLIVDGYNVIFASPELKALARDRLDLARCRLMDMLSNYAGFTKSQLVLVFDGFRTPGNPGSRSDYHNIHVVFTKDGERLYREDRRRDREELLRAGGYQRQPYPPVGPALRCTALLRRGIHKRTGLGAGPDGAGTEENKRGRP